MECLVNVTLSPRLPYLLHSYLFHRSNAPNRRRPVVMCSAR